jgi:hypothetical protein
MKNLFRFVALALLALSTALIAQEKHDASLDPHLYLTLQGFAARKVLVERAPWAKDALAKVLADADGYPQAYLKQFGLTKMEAPAKGAQWMHWYVCPETGSHLQFTPPNHNICPDTGKDYQDWPISDVHYYNEHFTLSRNAISLGIAYRMTGKVEYAQKAAEILKMYADKYQSYPIIDNYGGQTDWGARVFSQTLDEAIWLMDMTWSYDLVRGSGVLTAAERTHIENDLLLPAAAICVRGHKEPTLNIQSWINGAQASVGFELGRKDLIDEALNGPLGFRYQMKNYVHEGYWQEGSWGYHFYALRPLTATAEMAKRHGIDLWKEEPALATMFIAPLGMVLPNGDLPPFNDSDTEKLLRNEPVYEIAYENTHAPEMLEVLDKAQRTSKEALLFGVPALPADRNAGLKSMVFRDSGYAMLRAKHSDLNIVAKFGEHGGSHGHYDKLGEIVYAEGRVQGVDPARQLYGMALHKEWDQMSVAHNTLTADELRQDAAMGKLLAWKDEPNYTAVSMNAGPAYKFAELTRSILVTDEYALQIDRAKSTDGKAHNFDFNYHNFGKQTMDLAAQPYSGFPKENGYMHLSEVERGETSGEVKTRFDNAGTMISLDVLPAGPTEVFRGVAPGPDARVKVPFVIVRRKGTEANFVELLVPSKGDITPKITAQQGSDGTITVHGAGWVDTISLGEAISYRRASVRSR